MGVDVTLWAARLAGRGGVELEVRGLRAKRMVLATGSEPAAPPIPGLNDAGFLTNVTAFDQPALPARLIMLGGGPIGLELAQTYHRLGSTVTVLERLPEVLPREDPEVGRFVRERLEHEGVTIVTGFAAERVTCEASLKAGHGAGRRRVAGNEIFVATVRRPHTRHAEPEGAGGERANRALRAD